MAGLRDGLGFAGALGALITLCAGPIHGYLLETRPTVHRLAGQADIITTAKEAGLTSLLEAANVSVAPQELGRAM